MSAVVSEPTQDVLHGQVKWFDTQKGYGFIITGDRPDVFVHYSSIQMEGYRTLHEGDEVTFVLAETPKGLQAHNVAVTTG